MCSHTNKLPSNCVVGIGQYVLNQEMRALINLAVCLNGIRLREILLYYIFQSVFSYIATNVNNVIAAPKCPLSLFQTHINPSTTVPEGPRGLCNTLRELKKKKKVIGETEKSARTQKVVWGSADGKVYSRRVGRNGVANFLIYPFP